MPSLRPLVGLLAVSAVCLPVAAVAPPDLPEDYQRTRDKAERFYEEGSFARARQLYERLGDEPLPAAEARWVEFRVADTTWRAQAGSRTHDNSVYDKARGWLSGIGLIRR